MRCMLCVLCFLPSSVSYFSRIPCLPFFGTAAIIKSSNESRHHTNQFLSRSRKAISVVAARHVSALCSGSFVAPRRANSTSCCQTGQRGGRCMCNILLSLSPMLCVTGFLALWHSGLLISEPGGTRRFGEGRKGLRTTTRVATASADAVSSYVIRRKGRQ